jgi:hypothetical protein
MALVETWLNCELTEPVKVHYLKGNVFSMDSLGNRIGVNVYKNGQPATLSGSVNGYCVLSSGATVPVPGVRSGSTVYVDLIQDCYAISGPISIAIKLTDGDTITTLACIVANVYLSRTDQMITPGQSIIDDWTEQITEILQQCIDATEGTVKYSESQSLTDAQKTLARANIGAIGPSGLDGFVRYDQNQNLTSSQKAVARLNIGALEAAMFNALGLYVDSSGYVCQNVAQ